MSRSLRISTLKEAAFCSCLTQAYRADNINTEDVSMSIYWDVYNINMDILERIDSLAKEHVHQIKPLQPADYSGKQAYVLRCFDFMTSDSLHTHLLTWMRQFNIKKRYTAN